MGVLTNMLCPASTATPSLSIADFAQAIPRVMLREYFLVSIISPSLPDSIQSPVDHPIISLLDECLGHGAASNLGTLPYRVSHRRSDITRGRSRFVLERLKSRQGHWQEC
ncbi:hypothetical protein DOTSEDRAFT_45942 [Dothistroma septosporum NZE10]|uniref:Uncharacterized protein n=1 Tax=Dothistroma septosporum (strain NZE10 / CBS 128990) TaxID=675120 RepID=N1PM45_DOTSN|nr:hypothetical protein DOTSEDRAFT_45942 [Dothistroma septosporum NZE10]